MLIAVHDQARRPAITNCWRANTQKPSCALALALACAQAESTVNQLQGLMECLAQEHERACVERDELHEELTKVSEEGYGNLMRI